MKKSVLIVDDEELNRALLEQMLSDTYVINEASNGEEAIAFMDAHHGEVAVVLLDLVMPKMDGYEVLKVFTEKNWFDTVPVLVISGEQAEPIERKCLELGASDFVRKPFNPDIVRKRVDNAAELFTYKNRLEEKVQQQNASGTHEPCFLGDRREDEVALDIWDYITKASAYANSE